MSPVRTQPSRESEHWSKREPGIPSGGAPSRSSQGSLAPARPSHQSGDSRGWHGWNLTGASRNVAETSTQETKHHTRRVGELRFIMLAGPEELTLQALSPLPKGLQSFYRQDCSGQHWLLIGWFKLRGFTHEGTAIKMGRGMSDLYTDRYD